MTEVKNIVLVIGTRPEAIKMAPVYEAIKLQPGLNPLILATGQHREQLYQALSLFDVEVAKNLDLMTERQSLSGLAGSMLPEVARALKEMESDFVLVHGDTLTTFAVAWTAFIEGIPVGHVEAGLRSFNLREPFPEEANRRLTDVLTELDFAPTPMAKQNLLNEGKIAERIFSTGQTGIDAILKASKLGKFPQGIPENNLVTVTLHRRENWPVLTDLALALKKLALDFPKHSFIYPVHLNPVVRDAVSPILDDVENFYLLDPLEYGEMAALLSKSIFILTDSGGLQEEGAALGVPVGVVRNVTERPEGVKAGILTLLGNDPYTLYEKTRSLLENPEKLKSMASSVNPYGEGKASQRISKALACYFGFGGRPEDWQPENTLPFDVDVIDLEENAYIQLG